MIKATEEILLKVVWSTVSLVVDNLWNTLQYYDDQISKSDLEISNILVAQKENPNDTHLATRLTDCAKLKQAQMARRERVLRAGDDILASVTIKVPGAFDDTNIHKLKLYWDEADKPWMKEADANV